MMESNTYEHEQQVQAFFESCKAEDCERYEEVCKKYPVHSPSKRKRVRRKEVAVGLLGLCAARIPLAVAAKHGLESSYREEGE